MAVRIRMSRIGRKNTPFYRIGAFDAHCPRNGTCLEKLGWYNPKAEKPEKQLCLDIKKIEHWLSVGALPTPKMAHILKHAGIRRPIVKKPVTAERKAKIEEAKKNNAKAAAKKKDSKKEAKKESKKAEASKKGKK